jgi:hypothetical protein
MAGVRRCGESPGDSGRKEEDRPTGGTFSWRRDGLTAPKCSRGVRAVTSIGLLGREGYGWVLVS